MPSSPTKTFIKFSSFGMSAPTPWEVKDIHIAQKMHNCILQKMPGESLQYLKLLFLSGSLSKII